MQREELNIRIGIFEHVFQFINRLSNNLLLGSHALDNRANTLSYKSDLALVVSKISDNGPTSFFAKARFQRCQSTEYFNQFNSSSSLRMTSSIICKTSARAASTF